MSDTLFPGLPTTFRPPRSRVPLIVPPQPPDPSLATLRCQCGSSQIASLKPGREAVHLGAINLFTKRDPLLEAEIRDQAWCLPCLVKSLRPV